MSKDGTPLALVQIHPFTPREAEVIQQRLMGLSGKEIAQALGITEGTVKTHICNIFDLIEDITQRRPYTKNWLVDLVGDVILPVSHDKIDP